MAFLSKFHLSKTVVALLVTESMGLVGCQSLSNHQVTSQPAVIPATSLPQTVIAMPVPKAVLPQVLPKVITPSVVETIIKDPTPPKAVIDGNIAPEVDTITPEYLASYHWKLVKATDSHNKDILPLSNYLEKNSKFKKTIPILDFKVNKNPKFDNTVIGLSYTMGCNQYLKGKYLVDNVLTSINSQSITTLVGCGELNDAESQLGGLVSGTSQLSMRKGDIPFLTQITEHNSTLVWQGTQTARSRYAQEPDTVFLAISPDTTFCDDQTTRQCLQIKPVTYVDNKKVVTGDWLLLDGTIEGYNHNPDEAQVIRVERYTVVATPDKPKHYVYVLDQVIESAVVNK